MVHPLLPAPPSDSAAPRTEPSVPATTRPALDRDGFAEVLRGLAPDVPAEASQPTDDPIARLIANASGQPQPGVVEGIGAGDDPDASGAPTLAATPAADAPSAGPAAALAIGAHLSDEDAPRSLPTAAPALRVGSPAAPRPNALPISAPASPHLAVGAAPNAVVPAGASLGASSVPSGPDGTRATGPDASLAAARDLGGPGGAAPAAAGASGLAVTASAAAPAAPSAPQPLPEIGGTQTSALPGTLPGTLPGAAPGPAPSLSPSSSLGSVGPVSAATAEPAALPPGVQVARAALARGPGEVIEVRLDPPQLGRVQLAFDLTGDVPRAVVSAAQPETLDILRRGAPLLLQELAEGGLAEAEIEWSDAPLPEGREDGSAEILVADAEPHAEPVAEAPAPARPKRHHGVLDLTL